MEKIMQRVKPEYTIEEYEAKLAEKLQTMEGAEVPDEMPLAPPVGYVKQPSITERIRDMVRSEHLRLAAIAAGNETFEEAEDFDIPDDPVDPSTPYEAVFDPLSERERDFARELEREKLRREVLAELDARPGRAGNQPGGGVGDPPPPSASAGQAEASTAPQPLAERSGNSA